MKKNLKRRKQYSGDEVKRYLGIVHEEHMGALKTIGERFDGIDKRLDSHQEMIGKILIDMGIVKEDIGFIKNDLKRKVDIEEFAALTRRVSVLEKRAFK